MILNPKIEISYGHSLTQKPQKNNIVPEMLLQSSPHIDKNKKLIICQIHFKKITHLSILQAGLGPCYITAGVTVLDNHATAITLWLNTAGKNKQTNKQICQTP